MSTEAPPSEAALQACVEAVQVKPATPRSDFGWALGAVFRSYVTAVTAAAGDMPGGPRGYEVLATAAKNCPPNQLRLAQQLGIDKTVMTYLIDDLERAGLVERRPDPTDRRARQITVTPAGRERLTGLERTLADAEASVLATLSAAERETLKALLLRAVGLGVDGAPVTCSEVEDLAGLTP
jgi:DNA-binding MarR family transcriptional regulator